MKCFAHKLMLCLLWLPFCCPAMRAYTPVIADPLLEPWRWRNEEALAGLGVCCMDEAPDGSLWFGNAGSIARYDGVTVEVIPFDDDLLSKIVHRKTTPWVSALTVLPDGNLLVLIGGSLVLRSGDEWKVLVYDVGQSVFAADLERAADGTFWLIVPGALWHISADCTEATLVMAAAKNGTLGSFCEDLEGRLWVAEKTDATRSRLVVLSTENGQRKRREVAIPFETDATELLIAMGPDGRIWYADNAKQTPLATFDPAREEWSVCEGSPAARYYSLSTGRDGTLWAGGEKMICRIPPHGDPVLYTGDQLQHPQVPLSLFETGNNQLWVLGRVGYVHSVDIGFDQWMTYEKLHFQCEDINGTQWFRGRQLDVVVSHDPHSGEWYRYALSNGLIEMVYAVKASSDGRVWAAGSHNGRAAIAVYDGQNWTRFLHPEFAEWIEPRAVMEAADGTMWFGAGGQHLSDAPHPGGALQYGVDADGTVRLLKHHAPRDFPYYVTALTQDTDRTIWIGSTFLYRYEESAQSAVKQIELQGLNTVNLAFDHQGTLWMAKEHAGVYRQQPDGWELFSTRDGLAGIDLSDLLVLRDGTLLAASGQGISRFDGKTWTPRAFPKWLTMSRRWSGMHQATDGSLWFNFELFESQDPQLALNQTEPFRTVRYRPETLPPDTKVTDYLVRVAQPGNTHISWSANDPWSSTPSEELQYSWRLDDGVWSAFSHETSRTFLNLPSGKHTLEVRARDRAFNVDPTPDRIEFEVIPPIWQQAWFILLISGLVGLIGLLLWVLIRNREKHLLEQQKGREEHLKEMDRLKTGFFTNISHELRTPVTVIMGRLETMLSAETNEKRKEHFSTLIRNAQRVSTLVTQLLDFQKIEQGKLTIEATQGDLVPMLRDWVASMQVLAEQAQISCTLETMETCPGRFDFDKLQKICTNLIHNAIKYTKAGGAIRVTLHADNGWLQLVVEDTGVGIAPEHLAQVFDRFYRVAEESMAVGAGIGLNLTKELVALLGGTIRAESPIQSDGGRPGTRFAVSLPLERETPAAASRPGTTPEEAPCILVVEDDADIRDFIVDGLEPAYRVEAAENGAAGLLKARALIPDLIVTDIMMPVMDGIEMCRELKTGLDTSHIPVVMLTAKASLTHQIEGLKTGADDYITKPFHLEILQTRIANLLESRRRLREQFSMLPPTEPETRPESEFLNQAMSKLEENYADPEFKPEHFAAALNISLRSLQRKLKAVTDRTPKEFMNEFRMMRAADRLVSSQDTVAEITFLVGMDEPTNFSRMFKARFGMTPSQYRAEQRKCRFEGAEN